MECGGHVPSRLKMLEKRRARGWWQRMARGEQRNHLRLAQRNRWRLIGLGVWQTIRVGFQHTVLSARIKPRWNRHKLTCGQNRADFAPERVLEQVDCEPPAQRWSRASGWLRGRNDHDLQLPFATASANFTKKSSAVFLAALLIKRWPSWASLPPICASTS